MIFFKMKKFDEKIFDSITNNFKRVTELFDHFYLRKSELDRFMVETYDMLFALASRSGVSPKQLADAIRKLEQHKYGTALKDALDRGNDVVKSNKSSKKKGK